VTASGIRTMGIVATIRSMLAAALALVALAAPAAAQTFPALGGRVVDAAHVLSPGVPEDLAATLKVLESRTSHQLVVATVPSLEGRSVEDYANRLFRAWRLGGKEQNDGVLLLVVPSERKLRIEVGYGLEGVLPDAIAKVIIEQFMVPHLRAGRIDAAVTAGVMQIGEVISGRDGEVRRAMRARAASPMVDESQSGQRFAGLIILLPFIIIPLFIPLVFLAICFLPIDGGPVPASGPRGSSRDWDRGRRSDASSGSSSSTSSGSSSSSSDSFSGGGGSSGGGGASGSW
jgi:uncharacterized protein